MTPKGQKQKPRRWEHQSIDIDQHKLDALYGGNKRNYLFHEDPEFRAFTIADNKKRHDERMKTDPVYREKNNIRLREFNRFNNSISTLTKERYEKRKQYMKERFKKDPEYFTFQW